LTKVVMLAGYEKKPQLIMHETIIVDRQTQTDHAYRCWPHATDRKCRTGKWRFSEDIGERYAEIV